MIHRDAVVSEQDLEQLAALFRLLSDKTRLNILLQLCRGERNVTSLCEELGLPQPTVSHHLGLLRMHNVVNNRRDGKQVYYGFHGNPPGDGNVMQFFVQKLCIQVRARQV